MNRSIISLSLICLAITGCSTVSKKSAIGDFDYANQDKSAALVIPEGLAKPQYINDYEVNDKINHKGPIGEQVDVRAPSLVLPIATASRIENSNEKAKIWFDKVIEDKDLKALVYQSIVDELASSNVSLTAINDDSLLYQSSWFTNSKETGWLFTSIEETLKMKFSYQLETKPHGRSVGVTVELIDYEKTNESGTSAAIDLIDKQRLEMAMLNEIVSQVDFKYRSAQKENQLLRANQQLVSIGENSSGEAAYIVEMNKALLWSNMPILFSKYGFAVNDLNESKQQYFVTYTKPEVSVWDSLWGEEAPVIDLTEGRYQFNLAESGDNSSVTLLNEQGEALSNEKLTALFDVMSLALSFRDAL